MQYLHLPRRQGGQLRLCCIGLGLGGEGRAVRPYQLQRRDREVNALGEHYLERMDEQVRRR